MSKKETTHRKEETTPLYTITEYAKKYNKLPQNISTWVKEGLFELGDDIVGTNLIKDNDNNRLTLLTLTRRKK